MNPLHFFEIIVLVFSVVVHEVSHGLMAYRLGDPTAKMLGRLTFNPIKHLDPIGSILVPLVLLITNSGVLFGWAKPVPFDPRNLRDPLRQGALIALIGPLSNIALAFVFSLLFRGLGLFSPGIEIPALLPSFFALVVYINISLAIFNLLPIPPLDGSKILYALLPNHSERLISLFETYGFFILILVLFTGVLRFIYPVVEFLVNAFLGVTFL